VSRKASLICSWGQTVELLTAEIGILTARDGTQKLCGLNDTRASLRREQGGKRQSAPAKVALHSPFAPAHTKSSGPDRDTRHGSGCELLAAWILSALIKIPLISCFSSQKPVFESQVRDQRSAQRHTPIVLLGPATCFRR
jgi:hypothetical protein